MARVAKLTGPLGPSAQAPLILPNLLSSGGGVCWASFMLEPGLSLPRTLQPEQARKLLRKCRTQCTSQALHKSGAHLGGLLCRPSNRTPGLRFREQSWIPVTQECSECWGGKERHLATILCHRAPGLWGPGEASQGRDQQKGTHSPPMPHRCHQDDPCDPLCCNLESRLSHWKVTRRRRQAAVYLKPWSALSLQLTVTENTRLKSCVFS